MGTGMVIALAHGVGLLALVLLAYRLLLRRTGRRRMLFALLSGLLFGAAAVLSMMDGFTVTEGVIVDLRNVMVALAGLFGGWPAALVAAAAGGAYRVWLGGDGTATGLLGVASTGVAAPLLAPLLRRAGREPGLWRLVLFGLALSPLTLGAFLLLPSWELAFGVLRQVALPLTGFTVVGIALLGTTLAREHRRVVEERTLAESEAMFRAVFDHSADSLFIGRIAADGSFILQRGNAAAFAAMGTTAAQAQGQPLDRAMPPAMAAKVTADLQSCIDSGGPIRFQDKETRDGVTRYWEVSQVPIRDAAGIIAMVSVGARDITRRHEAERAIRESEARYRLLARSVSDIIGRIGMDGVRCFCSEAVRDSLGCDPAEMVGRPLVERIHPDDRAAVADGLGRMTPTSPTMKSTYRMRHAAGHWVWFESAVRLVADDWGAPLEFVSVERDVTARKTMEAELLEARRAAEAANRSKSEFLASLSHELRTPMNAVIGFADLIARESEGPIGNGFYKDFAMNIRDSGQHLLELINEILDNVRAEAGQLVLDDETVELKRAVTFAIRLLTPRAARAGITLTATVDPQAGHLRGDEKRVRQILLNLLTNAVKYTPAGGRVSVGTALDPDGGLTLEVKDNGMGIAEQDLGRVLQAFGRVESAANNRIEGTGLGLPLTRRLVELHGGTLTLSSRVGQGTTATARFPAGRVVDERGHRCGPDNAAASPRGPLSILLVEDDQTIRETGTALLRGWGHRVIGAAGASEALVVLRGSEPLDLLFTDIVMPPGMNGAELAREAQRLRPGLPVLLASGFATHAVIADDTAPSGHDEIAKPYDPEELRQRLDRLRPQGGGEPAVESRLPATEAAPAAAMPAEGLRVLVAEDVEMNRILIVTLLKQAGHRVVAVEDGAAAVAATRRHAFDLILMDVNMPVMDGLTATRAIRDMVPPVDRTPIVALTASSFPEDIARCRAAGMDGYVPKPIDRHLLMAEIVRCLPSRPDTAEPEMGLGGKGRPAT